LEEGNEDTFLIECLRDKHFGVQQPGNESLSYQLVRWHKIDQLDFFPELEEKGPFLQINKSGKLYSFDHGRK